MLFGFLIIIIIIIIIIVISNLYTGLNTST